MIAYINLPYSASKRPSPESLTNSTDSHPVYSPRGKKSPIHPPTSSPYYCASQHVNHNRTHTSGTYLNSFSISILIHLVLICTTANAAYPGSVICRSESTSRSIASRRLASLKAWGGERYGGRGWPFVIAEERRERSDVISWDVMFEAETMRRKSWNHCASDGCASAPMMDGFVKVFDA